MNHRIRYRLLQLQARLLRNLLASASLVALLASCSGGDKKVKSDNSDSLKLIQEKRIRDSLTADSLRKIKVDTFDYRNEPKKYGAPPDYRESTNNDKPKYGAPVYPEMQECKYGCPN